MPTNEEILVDARERWKCNTDTESLILQVRSLYTDIEIYRTLVTLIYKGLRDTTNNLQNRGGE